MKAARKLSELQQPRSLLDFVRQFLTPQAFKQARQAIPSPRAARRWDLQPLLLVALAMTWAGGDSREERFETARGFYVAAYRARKRPGQTLQGFQKALSRLPMRQLRAFSTATRAVIRRRFAERLVIDRFEPMGCDGSRLECPRSKELEDRFRPTSKEDCAPTVWLTAFVHLGTGLLWSWRLGPGTADERRHLRQLLGTLSPAALIVADAAYLGYELAWAIVRSRRSFLLRLSSNHDLFTLETAALETWSEGPVYYWPQKFRKERKPPLACRLIRVAATGKAKHDVWLLTDVLDPARLSVESAARFYRRRWRNEGLFRTYKRTISKMRLSSRTVRLVHREAEVSLLALQRLLAHADLALRPTSAAAGEVVVSPRKVLLAIRKELKGEEQRRQPCYRERLKGCAAGSRRQTSPKERRQWPRRKPHKAPGPPNLHTLDDTQKALLQQHLDAA